MVLFYLLHLDINIELDIISMMKQYPLQLDEAAVPG